MDHKIFRILNSFTNKELDGLKLNKNYKLLTSSLCKCTAIGDSYPK